MSVVGRHFDKNLRSTQEITLLRIINKKKSAYERIETFPLRWIYLFHNRCDHHSHFSRRCRSYRLLRHRFLSIFNNKGKQQTL
jgi:hypothetical protein